MRKIVSFLLIVFSCGAAYAQKQTFDIVSYNAPPGWTTKQEGTYISYSRIDGGSWAQIALYQHRNSDGSTQTDFDKEWNDLVATGKTISSPEKTEPQTADGWTVISGSGVWQYNGTNVASVLTVYSNNQVCVSVLCNATAQPYLKDYQALLGSLDLNADSVSSNAEMPVSASSEETTQPANTNNSPLAGKIWEGSSSEKFNGSGMNTGGFFTKQYQFNADGTYRFVDVLASHYTDTKTLNHKTGTWSVGVNQLTIKPSNGQNEEWSKAEKTTNGNSDVTNRAINETWGKKLKMVQENWSNIPTLSLLERMEIRLP